MNKDNPLTRAVPKEVHLNNAPLVRVIAQLKFSMIASIEKQDFIAEFQEAIRDDYPILRPEQAFSFSMGPMGSSSNTSAKIWRFINEQEKWTVSLSQDFVAIETPAYTSRTDFLKRWNKVLVAAVNHLRLKQYERLGVRYIDRIQGEAMANIKKFVRSEALGIIESFSDDEIMHTFNETLFKIEDSQLLARWGKLTANSTFDPTTIEPIPNETWVLDLDMFKNKTETLDVEKIIISTNFYAERIYSFFRWAVTNDFLKYYGGNL